MGNKAETSTKQQGKASITTKFKFRTRDNIEKYHLLQNTDNKLHHLGKDCAVAFISKITLKDFIHRKVASMKF